MKTQNSQTTLNTAYFLNGTNENITLELLISPPGQTSTSVISLDDIPINESPLKGDVFLTLGSNAKLDKKVLRITTIVTDTSKESNQTGVDVIIKGGVVDKEYPLQEVVLSEGDSVAYSIIIRFKKFIST